MKLHSVPAFVALCISVLTVISDTEAGVPRSNEFDLNSFVSLARDCLHGDFVLCLKEKVLHYGERLRRRREIPLVSGFSLVDGDPSSVEAYHPLPADPVKREAEIDTRIYDIAGDFVTKFKVQYEESVGDHSEEGRKKKKIKKILPILELFKTANSALVVLFLSIITKLAIKLHIFIKLVSIIGGILFLKKYLSGDNHSEVVDFSSGSHPEPPPTSYGVHPIIPDGHHDDHHGYLPPSIHDSGNDAHNLAYGAYGQGTKHGDIH